VPGTSERNFTPNSTPGPAPESITVGTELLLQIVQGHAAGDGEADANTGDANRPKRRNANSKSFPVADLLPDTIIKAPTELDSPVTRTLRVTSDGNYWLRRGFWYSCTGLNAPLSRRQRRTGKYSLGVKLGFVAEDSTLADHKGHFRFT